MSTPRIVPLTGAPHPQARIDAIDAATGICVFSWLDAAGSQVDSGGSIARFTPLAPLPPVEGAAPSAPVYPDVADATLAAAIANPPAEPLAVSTEITPRQIRLWLLSAGIRDADVRALLLGNEAALIEWEFAPVVHRAHPLVAQLGTALGFNSGQIDAAFRAASTL